MLQAVVGAGGTKQKMTLRTGPFCAFFPKMHVEMNEEGRLDQGTVARKGQGLDSGVGGGGLGKDINTNWVPTVW